MHRHRQENVLCIPTSPEGWSAGAELGTSKGVDPEERYLDRWQRKRYILTGKSEYCMEG